MLIEDDQAYDTTRRLASEEGILVRSIFRCFCVYRLEVAKRKNPGEVVVCLAPDTGERYLSGDLFDF